MKHLVVLKLSFNAIGSIPKEIEEFSELLHLELIDTGLKRLPREMGNLKKMHTTYLGGNSFETLEDLPWTLGEILNWSDWNAPFQVLALRGCPLCSAVPELKQDKVCTFGCSDVCFFKGDMWCQPECNTTECEYDGGDCLL